MNWLLWEASDTKMMLVKKTKAKRKAPRCPSSTGQPPSPALSCAQQPATIDIGQQLYSSRAQTTVALPAYEPPPPPYSHPPVPPKDTYPKSPCGITQPPALPPRPPKLPLAPPPPPKNPWSLKRSRNGASCTDIPKLAATNGEDRGHDVKQRNEKSSASSVPANSLEDLISTKLDAVLTSIDGESFSGNEQDLGMFQRP